MMLPVLNAKQMRWADQQTIQHLRVPEERLMDRAGMAVAEAAMERRTRNGYIFIVCGPGNNGGDGLAAARHLRVRYKTEVCVICLRDPGHYRGACRHHLDLALKHGIEVRTCESGSEVKETVRYAGLLVDALFGTGLVRDISGTFLETIEALNELAIPTLAVDIASGINSDNGAAMGQAVQATWTKPIAAYKWGHWLGEGALKCGEVLKPANIGIPTEALVAAFKNASGSAASAWLLDRLAVKEAFRPSVPTAHKKQRGHLWIFGGSHGYTGAPRLAARGAFAVGTGLVSIACPEDVYAVIASACLETMVHSDSHANWQSANAVLAGPGWGRERGKLLATLLASDKPLVLDADALNIIAENPELAQQLAHREGTTVLTPHPGEAGRLLGTNAKDVQANRREATIALAERFNCHVLLKGAYSLACDTKKRMWINPIANARLATAGSGDVLAGMIAGLMARGMDADIAINGAVHLHGLTGCRKDWLTAGELASKVPEQLEWMRVDPV